MTCIYFNWPYLFDEKLVDVSDTPRRSAESRRLARFD